MAENLQKKYPKRWRENKRILGRINSFHQKAKRIMEDFARKVGKWVVEIAEVLVSMLLSWRVSRILSRM